MFTDARRAAAREARPPGNVLHSARLLVRRLEAIAAQHDGQDDVVAVCEKWAFRVSQLERQAIEAGIDEAGSLERH
jgi:hypothetical protein